MAGYLNYPKTKGSKCVRTICSGKITKIDKYEFEHTFDSRASSSGSPICLIDNSCVVGIHKSGHKEKPINFGTFIGIILDDLKPYESSEEKNLVSQILKKKVLLNPKKKFKI